MATEEQLKKALIQAHNAGDTRAAQVIADRIKANRQQMLQQETGQQSDAKQMKDNPAQQPNLLESYAGGVENTLSMATGAVGEVVGGVAGLLSLPFTGSNAGSVVESVSDFLTYQPKTEAGKRLQQKTAELMQPAGEAISKKPGDYMFKLAQSPEFRAAASLNPQMRFLADNPEVAGTIGAAAIPAALELAGMKGAGKIKTAKQARSRLANEIASGNRNIDNITKTLDMDGRLINNPKLKKIASIIPDDVKGKHAAILLENMNTATKKQFNKMLDVVDKQRRLGPEYAMDNRLTNVVGESIAKRVKALEKVRQSANQQMTKALNSVGDEVVDISSPARDFMQKLREAGVKFQADDAGRIMSDFSDARLNLGDVLPKQRLDDLINQMRTGSMPARQAHDFKRFIREFVSYDGGGLQPVGAKQSAIVSSAIKDLSRDVGAKIGDISDDYARANAKYQTIADPINKVSKQLKGMGVDEDIGVAKLGDLAKRIGTNYGSRQTIMEMIDAVDEGLRKNKINFKDNVKQQVAALDVLDQAFQTSRTESPFGFRAGVESGTRAAAGDKFAMMQIADDAIKKLRDKSFEEKMRVLRGAARSND